MTPSQARDLFYLGAQLTACCGEAGPLTSMLGSAQFLESGVAGTLVSAENGLSDGWETPARAGAEGAVVCAEIGVMAYHYARHLNNKPCEVVPAVLDLRAEKYQAGLTFLS